MYLQLCSCHVTVHFVPSTSTANTDLSLPTILSYLVKRNSALTFFSSFLPDLVQGPILSQPSGPSQYCLNKHNSPLRRGCLPLLSWARLAHRQIPMSIIKRQTGWLKVPQAFSQCWRPESQLDYLKTNVKEFPGLGPSWGSGGKSIFLSCSF